MVISDVKKNLIIEAAGYQIGYGELHELPCSVLFKEKTTLQDLVKAASNEEPIERIKKDGTTEIITKLKILQFSSVWQHHA